MLDSSLWDVKRPKQLASPYWFFYNPAAHEKMMRGASGHFPATNEMMKHDLLPGGDWR
jgi:hypothetical protein